MKKKWEKRFEKMKTKNKTFIYTSSKIRQLKDMFLKIWKKKIDEINH